MTDFTALPPIADSALPREIRDGSAAEKKAYKAALGFEQVLVGELVQAMTKDSSLAEGPRADAVSDAMTDAVQSAGGLGLAPQLYDAMKLQERGR
ncbi:MAG TPA: hypothetical protein VN213_08830 [Solirubrobacteraceae bacterium]|nr:hypothetical protein [Solirubrobacteraceae bacterium]